MKRGRKSQMNQAPQPKSTGDSSSSVGQPAPSSPSPAPVPLASSNDGPGGATLNLPGGVETPVFWGSLVGVAISAIFAGYSYLTSEKAVTSDAWIVTCFCVVSGIRYYTSVVFLSYADFLSSSINALSKHSRRAIFFAQLIMIMGTSLNVGLLTTAGVAAACAVILVQAASTLLYWIPLWTSLMRTPQGNFRLTLFVGEIAVALLAGWFVLTHAGVVKQDASAAAMILGMVVLTFLNEVVTTYAQSMRELLMRTRAVLAAGPQSV